MNEELLVFGRSGSLVGVLTNPPGAKGNDGWPGIIIMNAGLIHRVGPNRLSVKMARDLAARGFRVLRFDFSGIGDSPARSENLHFEERWVRELIEAMDFLQETHGIGQFVPMGICGAADTSYRAAVRDPRIVGACLINAQSHLHDSTDEQLDAQIENRKLARHQWRIALFSSLSAKKWLKAITGKVNIRTIVAVQLKSLFSRKNRQQPGSNRALQELERMAARGTCLFHVYSEGDMGLDYIEMILEDEVGKLNDGGRFTLETIPGANHTFTLLCNQEHLLETVRTWVRRNFTQAP